MEYIQNKIFYHIGYFEKNKTFIIGKELNPFYKYFYEFGYGNKIDFPQIKQLLSDYQLYARERIFEDIRAEFFPSLPSRKKCLWLLPTTNLLPRIKFWLPHLSSQSNKKFICKLRCSGSIHIGDESFLFSRFGHLKSYRDDAKKYWNGDFKPTSSFIHEEVIFVGRIYVEEVYSNLKNFIDGMVTAL